MKKPARWRPWVPGIFVVFCTLMTLTVPLSGYYFLDDFNDSNLAQAGGQTVWTLTNFQRGVIAPDTYTFTDTGTHLEVTGTRTATGGAADTRNPKHEPVYRQSRKADRSSGHS